MRPRGPRADARERRHRILILREAGLTQAEVARRLGISLKTVKRADAWRKANAGPVGVAS